MKIYLDCYPCFLRQALEASRMAGADEEQQRTVLHEVIGVLRNLDPTSTPPQIGDQVHRIVRLKVGDHDPYRAAKDEATSEAMELYPRLKRLVAEAEDPLETAIRLSIAGNIIDFGPNLDYDLWKVVEKVLRQPFAIDDGVSFREMISRVKQVLFLSDNAGETVFDRVLIEIMSKPVLYAVKGGPILNDATREDAHAAGVDRVAQIISTGSDAPGTVIECCSEEFRRLFHRADMIIAKGQANYETLSEQGARTFFLLQIKCSVIGDDVGIPVGSIIFKQGGKARRREL